MANAPIPDKKIGKMLLQHAVARLDRMLSMFELAAIALLLSTAAALNFSSVAARYLFNASVSSWEEISVYLILWMIFIGVVRADRLGQNISLDLALNLLSADGRRRLWRVADFLLGAVALILAWFALEAVLFSRMIDETSVSKLAAPIWVVMLIMPISLLMIGSRAIIRAILGRDDDDTALRDVELRV